MTNRKQKSQNKSAKAVTILKKFWWLITIVLALVSWLVYSQVRSYVLDQRFNSTYEQLDSMGKALRSSLPIVNDGSDPIEKKCRENYYGFNSEIECGVYLTLYPSDKYDRYRGMENILQELLTHLTHGPCFITEIN